jgi:uncharacterized membrane protein
MTNLESLTALDRRLRWVFTIGSIVSAACLAAGLVLYFVSPQGAAAARLLSLGLMILMATPLLRVVVSLVEYFWLRDWLFVLTTLVVLAELSFTVIYALGQR